MFFNSFSRLNAKNFIRNFIKLKHFPVMKNSRIYVHRRWHAMLKIVDFLSINYFSSPGLKMFIHFLFLIKYFLKKLAIKLCIFCFVRKLLYLQQIMPKKKVNFFKIILTSTFNGLFFLTLQIRILYYF